MFQLSLTAKFQGRGARWILKNPRFMAALRPLQTVLGEQGSELLKDFGHHRISGLLDQLGIAHTPVEALDLVR